MNGARRQAACRLRAAAALMSLVLAAGCSAGPVTGHPDISYSPLPGPQVQQLYRQAEAVKP